MSVAKELADKIPPNISSLNASVKAAAERGAVVTYTITPGPVGPRPESVAPPVITATITGPGI